MTRLTQNRRQPRGFTIVETLVAISILILAVTGPMVFAQSSLRAAAYARDQVTAFFLAQDAIEFVKHVRDENSLTGLRAAWLSGLAACIDQDCMVSSADVDIPPEARVVPGEDEVESRYATECPPGNLETCRLWIDDGGAGGPEFDSTYLYGVAPAVASGKTSSKFIRTVRITAAPGMSMDDEVQVSVKIFWQTHPLLPARQIDVRENIMNWIQ